jgi:putative endonuclease
MLNRQQQFGRKSEALAARHLKKNGYRILEQNYRTPAGEIDIIAQEGHSLVFVEVKARRTAAYGSPKRSVTPLKQKKISMAALHYLKTRKEAPLRARFDVVAITATGQTEQIEIVKNAFELAYE